MPRKECRPLPHIIESDIARFWSKVDRRGPDDCWPWKAGTWNGYGQFWLDCHSVSAHRVAHFLYTGNDPFPLFACHKCDFGLCCNGAHLFPGTNLDNIADRDAKGRTASGDRHWTRARPDAWWSGEHNYKATLTVEQVAEIRRLYALGGVIQKDLAIQYNVSPTAIYRVIRNLTWAR